MYSGDRVRNADIIEAELNTPDHRIGYAFIVGYVHADKAFSMYVALVSTMTDVTQTTSASMVGMGGPFECHSMDLLIAPSRPLATL